MKLVLLKTDEDFAHKKFSRSVNSASLRIRTALRNQNNPRFGFIVPKKVLPKVTDRNKVKRRLKSILVANLNSIKALDILFFPLKTSVKTGYKELEVEVINNLKKLNSWK